MTLLGKLAMATMISAAACGAYAQSDTLASATITQTGFSGGVYTYDMDLSNIGSSSIGTFWFAWVPGGDFLPAEPTNVQTPNGWTFDGIFGTGGYSLRWEGALAAGNHQDGFQFSSTDSLSTLMGQVNFQGTNYPILTSFVYEGAPFQGGSDQFVVQAVPEPATWALGAFALPLLSLGRRRKKA